MAPLPPEVDLEEKRIKALHKKSTEAAIQENFKQFFEAVVANPQLPNVYRKYAEARAEGNMEKLSQEYLSIIRQFSKPGSGGEDGLFVTMDRMADEHFDTEERMHNAIRDELKPYEKLLMREYYGNNFLSHVSHGDPGYEEYKGWDEKARNNPAVFRYDALEDLVGVCEQEEAVRENIFSLHLNPHQNHILCALKGVPCDEDQKALFEQDNFFPENLNRGTGPAVHLKDVLNAAEKRAGQAKAQEHPEAINIEVPRIPGLTPASSLPASRKNSRA